MAVTVDPNAVVQTAGTGDPNYAVDPNALAALNTASGPPKFDPNNPLGLTAAAPGYLPPSMRAPAADPDLNIVNGGYVPTGLGQPQLTPDQLNAINQNQIDWGNMDQAYWSPREQSPTPFILGALGAIAAPFALAGLGLGGAAAGAGGAAGSAAADALGATGALGDLTSTTLPAVLGGAAGAAGAAAPTVSELVVTAAAGGASIPAIAATTGLSAAAVAGILANSGGAGATTPAATTTPASTPPNEVSPLTVTAPTAGSSAIPAAVGATGLTAAALAAGSGGGNTVDGITVTAPQKPIGPISAPWLGTDLSGINPPATTSPSGAAPVVAGAAGAGLLAALSSGSPGAVGTWITQNPLQAAALGLVAGGAILGSGTPKTNGPGSGGPGDPNVAGTDASLNPIFHANLPPPTNVRTQSPFPQGIDWNRYAIDNPEQSFFSNVPQPGPAQFTVPTPQQNLQTGLTKLGLPDLAALKKRFGAPGNPVGYAKGGSTRQDFAVKGPGTGRSDSIPAKLSDGEYVMDAETVSMLGDGSNTAGAKKLDQMRVNLRKAKGKQLARGRFSVAAKDPETYYRGGRTDA